MASQQQGNGVTIKSKDELDLMFQAGQIVGRTHKILRDAVQPGMTTRELDSIAEREIVALGGKPAFKGYRGFPGTLCVSVNEEIVHGIPGDRVLNAGDLVSLDLGAI
ncbi:MAG: M24 family metallopeptidase, partial [Dehalococcoidia bacterium]